MKRMGAWLPLVVFVALALLTLGALRVLAGSPAQGPRDANPYSDEWLARYHGLVDNVWTAEYEARLQGPIAGDALARTLGLPALGPDVRLSNPSFAGSQSSFQIAINPNAPAVAIAVGSDGRSAGVAIYRTENGGLGWSVQDAPIGTAACCNGDVAYGGNGVVYVTLLDTSPAAAYVLRSSDDGLSWSAPAVLPAADRPSIAVDRGPASPRTGWVYLTYSDIGGSNRIKGYRSSDGGQTWTDPFFIGDGVPAGGYQQAGDPYVAPDGALLVGYQQYDDAGLGCAPGVKNVVARSSDGGSTWSYATLAIVQGGACTPAQAGRGLFCINSVNQSFRSRSHPIIAGSPLNASQIYMVYSGGDLETAYTCGTATGFHSDTLFRKSTDGGSTWGAPLKINQDPAGKDQYLPWMDVAPNGLIAVGWHDRRADANNYLHAWWQAYSTNGGTSWSESAVADQVSQPFIYIGDYAGLATGNDLTLGVWWDSRDAQTGDPYTDPGVPPQAGTPTPTATGTPPTATVTRTPSPTSPATATQTRTTTPSPTYTRTPTRTITPGPSPTGTPTLTPTACTPGQTDYAVGAVGGQTLVPGTADSGNHCDDCVTAVTLPFTVRLYDTPYSGSVNVSSNGTLQFVGNVSAFSNACLPDTPHNDTIFAHWDDLRTDSQSGCAGFPGGACGVFTSVTGSAPNRVFNVEWRAVYFSNAANALNFAIQLHENSANFEVVYAAAPDNGAGATLGVQQGAGARSTQFSCNSATLSGGLRVDYVLVACGSPTPTVTGTLSPTPTAPATATATRTSTPLPSSTPTATDVPSSTPTPAPSATPTPTAAPSDTPTATAAPEYRAYAPLMLYNAANP